jgi:hypothetical protein
LDVQEEVRSLNLACSKPVNQNVVWEGVLTALLLLLLLLLLPKKYFVPRVLDAGSTLLRKLSPTVLAGDGGNVKVSGLII